MKPTLLIVEDDPLNRKLLSNLLALKGYDVFEAHDGATGIEMAREHRPVLILMDLQMPGMDGFEAIRILKGDPQTRATAIWVLTSYAMPGDESRIRAHGCDNYFTKPLDLHDLLIRIARHVDGRDQETMNPDTPDEDGRQ